MLLNPLMYALWVKDMLDIAGHDYDLLFVLELVAADWADVLI